MAVNAELGRDYDKLIRSDGLDPHKGFLIRSHFPDGSVLNPMLHPRHQDSMTDAESTSSMQQDSTTEFDATSSVQAVTRAAAALHGLPTLPTQAASALVLSDVRSLAGLMELIMNIISEPGVLQYVPHDDRIQLTRQLARMSPARHAYHMQRRQDLLNRIGSYEPCIVVEVEEEHCWAKEQDMLGVLRDWKVCTFSANNTLQTAMSCHM